MAFAVTNREEIEMERQTDVSALDYIAVLLNGFCGDDADAFELLQYIGEWIVATGRSVTWIEKGE